MNDDIYIELESEIEDRVEIHQQRMTSLRELTETALDKLKLPVERVFVADSSVVLYLEGHTLEITESAYMLYSRDWKVIRQIGAPHGPVDWTEDWAKRIDWEDIPELVEGGSGEASRAR